MVNSIEITFSSQNGVQSKKSFHIKALMKDTPYLFLSFIILITVTFFGIVIRTLERYTIVFLIYRAMINDDGHTSFAYLWDSFWAIIIVMLTSNFY